MIAISHISRRFGAVKALDDVSFEIRDGRVHGVLGENGAGKTTIMNVVYGLVAADSGEILIDGKPAAIRSPRDAIARGIGMVHQHFMLAGAMSVLDNILLGDRRQGQWLSRRKAGSEVKRLAKELGWEVDPGARVDELSVGQQQRVEIIKALYRDIKILILDEPTAVLTPHETDQLLAAMRRLREQGKAVVFISHKLGEVKRICDDLTILRRGKVVWQGEAASASEEELAARMVGEEFETRGTPPKPQPPNAGSILVLDRLCARGIHDITLTLNAEILGIAGVDGNGQQELAELIVGLRRPQSGKILMADEDVTHLGILHRAQMGVAHVPNDRKREGLVLSMGVTENLFLKHHRRPVVSKFGVMRWKNGRTVAKDLTQRFDVRTDSISRPVSTLSGGNQQKVVLARELELARPKVIVAMNPTRGLDIAASAFVYEELLSRKAQKCGIILISSDLDELIRVSDRIAVLYRGKLTMTRFPEENVDQIGQKMAGLHAER